MESSHTAIEVADRFIRLSLDHELPVTPMKVQKLAFLAHAWGLGLGYGPLFQDAVEAWRYGPVMRMLYHQLKHCGGRAVDKPLLSEDARFDEREEALIRAIWRNYGEIPAVTLSSITHAPGSPWAQVYGREEGSQIIHPHLIRQYYADLAEANRSS